MAEGCNAIRKTTCQLSTGSTTSTSSILLPQDSVSSTSSPASTRSQNTSSPEWSQLRESRKIKNTNKDDDASIQHREICCRIFLIGWKNSQRNSWTKRFHLQRTHPQALLASQIQNIRETWYAASIVFILTSRRTQVANFAKGPKLQGFLAGNAEAKPYFSRSQHFQ